MEEDQETVGLVDLAAAPVAQQVARNAVVRGPDTRHGHIAQALRQGGAVHQVGQQQGDRRVHGCHSSPRTGKAGPRCSQFSFE